MLYEMMGGRRGAACRRPLTRVPYNNYLQRQLPFSEHDPLQQAGQFMQIRHCCPDGTHCPAAFSEESVVAIVLFL
jgi:hypothetical protein